MLVHQRVPLGLNHKCGPFGTMKLLSIQAAFEAFAGLAAAWRAVPALRKNGDFLVIETRIH